MTNQQQKITYDGSSDSVLEIMEIVGEDNCIMNSRIFNGTSLWGISIQGRWLEIGDAVEGIIDNWRVVKEGE